MVMEPERGNEQQDQLREPGGPWRLPVPAPDHLHICSSGDRRPRFLSDPGQERIPGTVRCQSWQEAAAHVTP